ncbi:MAG: hypothetical protein EHM48_04435 [Planctomycetaceae bacterium]|nr:MAG: hypothetical protein EHM48_04435 [Planctomycetaceae bacterium]
MKSLLMIAVLAMGTLLAGCDTLIESSQERSRRINLQNNLQMKMIVEDWDYLWLQERNSRLTQWHPYLGY